MGKGKAKVVIICIIAAIVIAAACIFVFGKYKEDNANPVNVDLALVMSDPDVSGFEGEGALGEITVNQDRADEIVAQIDGEEKKSNAADFFASVEYSADKIDGLSEGDKINIVANYDALAAEEAGIVVTNDKATFTCGKLTAKQEPVTINMPQWYKLVRADGDEVLVTCLYINKTGSSVTLPIEFMYCKAGGAMSEMVDTSGSPNLTYNGTGYYMEGGEEAPYGTITEVDNEHVKYALKQYGDSFSITVRYTINDNGILNVESSTGGEVQIPTGKYVPISSSEAYDLGGRY